MDQKTTEKNLHSEEIEFFDTHCHLDMSSYAQDLDTVLQLAIQAGVQTINTIGIDRASSEQAVQLAEQYPNVYASVGIHPHDATSATEDDLETIVALGSHARVIGYGEIGLDYYRKGAATDRQQQIFSRQLELAKELQLPVIIHDRDAHADTLRILKKHAPFPDGGILHCFSGDIDFARQIMALGFFISIPGIVTFKNAKALQTVATELPLEAMLLETDGPFLAPVPYRGKRNTPAFLLHTAEKIAELRKTNLAEIAVQTSKNAKALFKLPANNR